MKFSIEYQRIPLDRFRGLPSETYSERFFRAGEFTNAYVDAQCAAVLGGMASLSASDPRAAWEVASDAGVRPERLREFRWILEKLSRAGALTLDPSGLVGPGIVPPERPEPIRAEVIAEEPALEATLALVDAAAEGYPGFLRGEREGTGVLFNARTFPLWERYFSNDNPVYAATNLLGAYAAAAHASGRPLRILEAGGGLGSGAEALLLHLLGEKAGGPLAAVKGTIEHYAFTEVSPGFLRRAQDRLLARFPGVPFEFRQLDLNRALDSQGVPRGTIDLCYAVNTLHVVRDLVVSLGELHASLRPGGLLCLVEAVRPSPGHPLYMEFVFQLLREFREFRRDPDCRPNGGFLDWASWQAALRRAGFEDVRAVPETRSAVEAYPGYAMAAILGTRAGKKRFEERN
jgi:SAM-dependent methyltransferase